MGNNVIVLRYMWWDVRYQRQMLCYKAPLVVR